MLPPDTSVEVDFDTIVDDDADGATVCDIYVSDCYLEWCPSEWNSICYRQTQWCVSPFIGEMDWWEAYAHCAELYPQSLPGFWPSAGPYIGVFPPDFFDSVSTLPIVVATFSSVSPDGVVTVSFSCFNQSCGRDGGVILGGYASPDEGACETVTSDYHGMEACIGWGVGVACHLPYWCVIPFIG